MKSLQKLLLVIACAGVTGSAPDTEQPRSAGSDWPAIMTDAQAANVTYPGREAPAGAGTLQSPSGVDRLIDRAASRLAAVPESPGWLQLVCGLVFVGFMAQRRSRPPAD